jgi:HSP20 family molecular chaperone IbpA
MQTQEATRKPRHESRSEAVQTLRPIAPPVDIYENEQELLLLADLPGVTREAITVQFEPEKLTFEAARVVGDQTVQYKRVFTVAPIFDADRISASYERGVLRLTLGKSAAVRPRQIPVTSR